MRDGRGAAIVPVGEMVVADPRLTGEGGVRQVVARYPTRRDFLRRVKVGAGECTLECLTPVVATMPEGTEVMLKVSVGDDPAQDAGGEVLRVRRDFAAAGSLVLVRLTGVGRATLASVFARASGRAPELGWRDGPRVPVKMKVAFASPAGSARGVIRNLSRRGAFVQARGRLPDLDAQVELAVRTGFFRVDSILTRVRWVSAERGGFGVQFVEMSPRVQLRLARMQ